MTRRVPGKENTYADALSRASVDRTKAEDQLAEGALSFTEKMAIVGTIEGSDTIVADVILEKIKLTTANDPKMSSLGDIIQNGFPNAKCNLPVKLRRIGL